MSDLSKTGDVLGEVFQERRRQNEKWGQQDHPNGTGGLYAGVHAAAAKSYNATAAERGEITYADILEEEFWEAMEETDTTKLRAELIQLAAVAVAFAEKIDRDAKKAAGV